MGKNSAAGQRAYRETRSNGGSKEQAKEACNNANQNYYQREQQRHSSNNVTHKPHEWDDDINDGCWHTADDL